MRFEHTTTLIQHLPPVPNLEVRAMRAGHPPAKALMVCQEGSWPSSSVCQVQTAAEEDISKGGDSDAAAADEAGGPAGEPRACRVLLRPTEGAGARRWCAFQKWQSSFQ